MGHYGSHRRHDPASLINCSYRKKDCGFLQIPVHSDHILWTGWHNFLLFGRRLALLRIELHICILSGNSRSMPIPLAHKLLDLEPFDHEFRRISKRVCRQGDKFTLASISYKIHGSNLYANDSEIFFRKTILVTDFIDLKWNGPQLLKRARHLSRIFLEHDKNVVFFMNSYNTAFFNS